MPISRYALESTGAQTIIKVTCGQCVQDPRPVWAAEGFVHGLMELQTWVAHHELTAHIFTVPMPVVEMDMSSGPEDRPCPAFHATYGTCVGPRLHNELHMNVFGQRWHQDITPDPAAVARVEAFVESLPTADRCLACGYDPCQCPVSGPSMAEWVRLKEARRAAVTG